MITIRTEAKFEALFSAVLLKKILVSNATKIVLESDMNSSKLSLDITSYSLENLLHEYERKFDKIHILHSGTIEWNTLAEQVQAYLNEKTDHTDITFILDSLEHILSQDSMHQSAAIKNLQKKLQFKNPISYGISLLPLQFATRLN